MGHHGLGLIERHVDTGFFWIIEVIIPEANIFHLHTVVADRSPIGIIEKVCFAPEADRVCGRSRRELTEAKVLDGPLDSGHHLKNVGIVKHRAVVKETLLACGKLIITPNRVAVGIFPVSFGKEIRKRSIGCRKEGLTAGL